MCQKQHDNCTLSRLHTHEVENYTDHAWQKAAHLFVISLGVIALLAYLLVTVIDVHLQMRMVRDTNRIVQHNVLQLAKYPIQVWAQ
jgi:hypothetical protein